MPEGRHWWYQLVDTHKALLPRGPVEGWLEVEGKLLADQGIGLL